MSSIGHAGSRAVRLTSEVRLKQLELLVDELIKESPRAPEVQKYMHAAGLQYNADPIDCMNQVLAALNKVRDSVGRSNKGGEHGQGI